MRVCVLPSDTWGVGSYRVQFPVPQKVFDAIGRKEKEAGVTGSGGSGSRRDA